MKFLVILFRSFMLIALLVLTVAFAQAQTSTFTYQGRLSDGGTPANGTYDLQFKLYDALTLGNLQGSPDTVTRTAVNVTNGVFTVQLDFGASGFPGADRYLEISVQHNGGGYTTLLPRQQLTSTPYAISSAAAASAPWSGISGVPPGFADGVDNDTTYSAGTGLQLSGTQLSADFNSVQARVSGTCAGNSAISGISANGQVICVVGNFVLKSGDTMTGGLTLPSLTLTGNGVITAPRVENSASDPATASASNSGRLYLNTGTKALKFSDGTAWQSVVTANLATSTSGATPSVTNLTVLVLNYTTVTTITDLTGGLSGQCVVLINAGSAGSAPINNSGNFKLNSNWGAASDDTLTVCRYNGFWYETARKNPPAQIFAASINRLPRGNASSADFTNGGK
jgi:hypothetical protein